jgi:UDPglucose 6-dehydrogenase
MDFDTGIILVNTPSDENGNFSNRYIYDVVKDISEKLKESGDRIFHLIISSTVMPSSHKQIIELMENGSGKKLNEGFTYSYVPDLVALGNVIKDFENPDVLIIGASNDEAAKNSKKLYSRIIKQNTPIVEMSIQEAEICKVSLNSYITMKISFANFIGNICDKLGCDPAPITTALGFDRRISPYYIKSGLSFGGTCFPRDTHAFIEFAKSIDLKAHHIEAVQKINHEQDDFVYKKIKKLLGSESKLGILGLSFKPLSPVMTESPSIKLIKRIIEDGDVEILVYDKLIGEREFLTENEELKEKIIFTDSIEKVYNTSNVIFISHPDKDFIRSSESKIIYDPWGIIKKK